MPRKNIYQILANNLVENSPDEVMKSRSQKKRDCNALQELGESLIGLARPRLAAMPLPPILLEAIFTAKSMKDERAKRRQIQYIGRLMREEIDDVQPIMDALNP